MDAFSYSLSATKFFLRFKRTSELHKRSEMETQRGIQNISTTQTGIDDLASMQPFACNICKKTFRKMCLLMLHVNLHTQESLYSCSVCSKSFARSDYLAIHRAIHTREKKFLCDLCGRSFAFRSSMSRHKLIHNTTKRYKCDGYDKTFYEFNSKTPPKGAPENIDLQM